MLQSMKKYDFITCTLYYKKINRIDDFENWPVSIKSTIQWFPFLGIMKYTGNDMQNDTHLTSSLLKMFSLFEIRLSCGDVDLDTV